MTDDEVLQALECCGDERGNRCDTCPQLGMNGCMNLLMQNALDLIKRQQAEIEKLQKEKDSKLVMCIANDKDKIKSEAIKDFSERLCKGRVSNDPVVIAVQVELKDMDGGEW